MIGCNYWDMPNMGKIHLMSICDLNNKVYTHCIDRYFFYKHSKESMETFFVRKGQSKVDRRIKEIGSRVKRIELSKKHRFLQEERYCSFEEIENLRTQYFGHVDERYPPDILMKNRDPVDVFFTRKWYAEIQEHFPISPSTNYFGTFLEPYLQSNTELIMSIVDELLDVDMVFDPFSLMGLSFIKHKHKQREKSELESYVYKSYQSRKNVVPYKEDLIDCFTSKLKRYQKGDIIAKYKKDKKLVWQYLDNVVKNLRRIEKFLQNANIDIVYFNMDRDDYKQVFGFEKNDLPRTATHPGDYPEREMHEKIAKEYVIIRDMKDMRRRNRLRDRIQ
tara:strand:+ start:392 stop:1390 length:999 start_codon:yes stop_codon:yes gene_type:complete